MRLIEQAPKIAHGVSAESDAVRLKPILSLRKLFKRRSDLLNLTVNDLLVLYRVMHAFTYRLDPALEAELQQLAVDRKGGNGRSGGVGRPGDEPEYFSGHSDPY
jgi:hypothetical protein